eukprot:CAMPEP_0201241600 /NCGR_PEP_ID=MMETSP0852-20130820/34665_1 /ASSEMBLY_ACC=CAM_ASM_000632 /TAXON_ID=183588 /ORGANISM="Pseudo-nitzschia fraudulenta, Strain WWA7" /LENGTH=66 /DNA_ID=CAMNT_0047537935 /DNA_START=1 /DNA_END=198 /DNA_ORIENTATION=-
MTHILPPDYLFYTHEKTSSLCGEFDVKVGIGAAAAVGGTTRPPTSLAGVAVHLKLTSLNAKVDDLF